MRGYKAAQEYHKNNTGLGYMPFKLEKDGESAVVRVLQPQDEWVCLAIHQDFNKGLKSTRCLSETLEKDPDKCPLCLCEAKRSVKTFIPVRVRGDQNESRVQVIEYGRNALEEVVSQIEELPAGTDITNFDFKIKRKGLKLDTTYKWIAQNDTKGALGEAEKALEIPDMEELLPADLLLATQRVKAYINSSTVTPVARDEDEDKGAASRSRF
jgi:hypothetical protein